jgi:hypothetical protein
MMLSSNKNISTRRGASFDLYHKFVFPEYLLLNTEFPGCYLFIMH